MASLPEFEVSHLPIPKLPNVCFNEAHIAELSSMINTRFLVKSIIVQQGPYSKGSCYHPPIKNHQHQD
uniref:Uncharacterized protein n=1 Tax=mine drainage metagenome TaxID=410659 RepID=E6QXG7_9ZZZZ